MNNYFLKKAAKVMLCGAIVVAGCFYCATVLAYRPVVSSAGPDKYLNYDQYNTNLTTTLQGSGSDPNGGTISFYWSCNGGFLSDPYIAKPIFTASYNMPLTASYTCKLKVTDSYGISASDNMTVYLNSSPATGVRVQTTKVTNISNNGATLNGNFYANNTYSINYVTWFQWGISNAYGAETNHQAVVYSGIFSQNVTGLVPDTLYHYRLVAQRQNTGQMHYGQDMTFYTNSSGVAGAATVTPSVQILSPANQSLVITKTARNLSLGNLNWSNSVDASPEDVIQFSIAVSAPSNFYKSQGINHVNIKEALPNRLTYKNHLTLDGASYQGDITQGLDIGSMSANQTKIITYHAEVAPAQEFSFGQVVLQSIASVTSPDLGFATSAASAFVAVKKQAILAAATTVSTGLTNNFLLDSFFLPLLLALLGIWLFKSGFFGITDWFDRQTVKHKHYRVAKQLKDKITQIQQKENT